MFFFKVELGCPGKRWMIGMHVSIRWKRDLKGVKMCGQCRSAQFMIRFKMTEYLSICNLLEKLVWESDELIACNLLKYLTDNKKYLLYFHELSCKCFNYQGYYTTNLYSIAIHNLKSNV